MKLQRFALSQSTVNMILAVITLVTLSIVIVMINYNFQVAEQSRQQLLQLTIAIHNSDLLTANKTDALINAHIQQDQDIHGRQETLIKNQLQIINNTNAAAISLEIIRHASDQVDAIVARQKNNTQVLYALKNEIEQRLLSK